MQGVELRAATASHMHAHSAHGLGPDIETWTGSAPAAEEVALMQAFKQQGCMGGLTVGARDARLDILATVTLLAPEEGIAALVAKQVPEQVFRAAGTEALRGRARVRLI